MIACVVKQLHRAAEIRPMLLAADADMPSASNLNALDEARLRFIARAHQFRAAGGLGVLSREVASRAGL